MMKTIASLLAVFGLYGVVGQMDYEDAVSTEQARKDHVAWLQGCKAAGFTDRNISQCPSTAGSITVAQYPGGVR